MNFNARFIPDHATVAGPLRRWTEKGEPFIFDLEQQVAFADPMKRLAEADTLGYFDRTARTKIITDASPVGLGVVLLQEQKGENHVISYASRGLSDLERRYSQTEKKALGIYGPVRGFMCIFMEWILNCGRTTKFWNLSTQCAPDPLRQSRGASCGYSPTHFL